MITAVFYSRQAEVASIYPVDLLIYCRWVALIKSFGAAILQRCLEHLQVKQSHQFGFGYLSLCFCYGLDCYFFSIFFSNLNWRYIWIALMVEIYWNLSSFCMCPVGSLLELAHFRWQTLLIFLEIILLFFRFFALLQQNTGPI